MMEFQMFEVLGMRLSIIQEELRQLCLEILAEYTTELAHLARPKHPCSSGVREPPLALTRCRRSAQEKERQVHHSVPEGDDESDRGSDPNFESYIVVLQA